MTLIKKRNRLGGRATTKRSIIWSAAAGVETPKKEKTVKTFLNTTEYTKMLAQAGGSPRDYAILQVFLQNDVPGETRGRLVSYLQQARQDRLPSYWTEEDGADQRIQAVCHLVLTLPEFQLD